jgi:tRNA threonylcarbamoyladenosine biosynthesis protein TsaE
VLTAYTTEAGGTRDLASALAGLIRPGDLLVLAGELGAGKTAFTQGLGAALGVTDRITSPTFTIAQEYEARGFTLHHLDVYRLERLDEISDVGLAEILDDGSVVVIEWGDAILPVLPPDFLELRFLFGEGDDDRVLHVRAVGQGWSARWPLVAKALAPWVKES